MFQRRWMEHKNTATAIRESGRDLILLHGCCGLRTLCSPAQTELAREIEARLDGGRVAA